MPYTAPTQERFWQKVNKTDDCWIWTGGITSKGYGNFLVGKDEGGLKQTNAHRYSYALHVGDIPQELVIDHKCRIHACVNPDHLEPVTRGENVLRGIGISAENAKKTHCKYGHEFTPENTRTYNNHRACKQCLRRNSLEHYWRNK